MYDYLIVDSLANYRWVLGHWAREVASRLPGKVRIQWIPVSLVADNLISTLVKRIPLPKARCYYFTSTNIFKIYISRFPNELTNKSIVLYTHPTDDLGSTTEQVEYLNKAKKVHFMCSHDLHKLVKSGLPKEACRLVLGAVSEEVHVTEGIDRLNRSVLLSSRYGPRKGSDILVHLVRTLPKFSFTLMGPGWHEFINNSELRTLKNFTYIGWRNVDSIQMMKDHEIFLSISRLEGGPIPLLEALKCGMYVIATDTGFARDVLIQGITGDVISVESPSLIADLAASISRAKLNEKQSRESVRELTWFKMTESIVEDGANTQKL